MAYNMSTVENSTTLYKALEGVNDLSGGNFILYLVVFIYIFTFVSLKARGFDSVVCFIATGFITSILGGLFGFMGVLNWEYVIVPIISMIIALVVYWYQD